MDDAGVTVLLETEATRELVEEHRPDAVIVATGAIPATLPVRGADRKT